MRGKRQEDERAHVTTDNQNATHMEAKAASDPDALQYRLSRVILSLSSDSVCLTNSCRLVRFGKYERGVHGCTGRPAGTDHRRQNAVPVLRASFAERRRTL